MRYIRIVSVLALAAFFAPACCLFGCGGGSGGPTRTGETVDVLVRNSFSQVFTVEAELAVTPSERATGLMNRASLPGDGGMLFIFDDEQPRSFWMKNTLIPLDMIFIDAQGEIVDINENARPGDLNSYTSAAPAMYVLEVNGGYCADNNIEDGDTVEIPPDL